MNRYSRHKKGKPSGNIAIWAAVFLVPIVGLTALAVDIGYLYLAQVELQGATDAAALAGAAFIADDSRLTFKNNPDAAEKILPPPADKIRDAAQQFSSLNKAANGPVALDRNSSNKPKGDIVVGHFDHPNDLTKNLKLGDPHEHNTVWVTGQLSKDRNKPVTLFFARVLGRDEASLMTEAAATVWSGVPGFFVPDGGPLLMAPFALHVDEWDILRGREESDETTDDYTWDPITEQVLAGPDEIPELKVYPDDITSGNFGTLDLGAANNSNADIMRQIRNGLNADDLSYFGGEIKLSPPGDPPWPASLDVGGDTGMSAAMEDALADIIGETRILPIYSKATRTGNTSVYTIVAFGGIRIMEARLRGADKVLAVQLAAVRSRYAVMDPDLSLPNDLVFTSPRLTR